MNSIAHNTLCSLIPTAGYCLITVHKCNRMHDYHYNIDSVCVCVCVFKDMAYNVDVL